MSLFRTLVWTNEITVFVLFRGGALGYPPPLPKKLIMLNHKLQSFFTDGQKGSKL